MINVSKLLSLIIFPHFRLVAARFTLPQCYKIFTYIYKTLFFLEYHNLQEHVTDLAYDQIFLFIFLTIHPWQFDVPVGFQLKTGFLVFNFLDKN